jgi:hypothetical protein
MQLDRCNLSLEGRHSWLYGLYIYHVCDETFALKWTLFFCIAVSVLVRVLVSRLKCPVVVGFNYVSHVLDAGIAHFYSVFIKNVV